MNVLPEFSLINEYTKYLQEDTCKWTRGVKLLQALSKTFGKGVPDEMYLNGIKKVFSIKPSMAGREEEFFPDDFPIQMERIKKIGEEAVKGMSIGMMENINVPSFGKNGTSKYAVPTIKTTDELAIQIRKLFGSRRGILSGEGNRIFTFGSCFAVNVGQALKEKGQSVYTLLITEDVNSTVNNLMVLSRLLEGKESRVSKELEQIKGIDYAVIAEELKAATHIVFTLGNIFHFENNGEPTVSDKTSDALVTESVEQTVFCLKKIFQLLTTHTKAKILVSVSPIPISGYRGDEFQNAIEADCVSKSQLRAALNSVLKDFDITYVPTFEVFRWLPAHQTFATFAVDDDNPRHLSATHLSKVMEAIC